MDSHPVYDVQVRVHRSFSFEELQSGAYFNSLDESDLEFYCAYRHPITIPNWQDESSLHGSYPADYVCENSLHVAPPSVYSYKSYTLQGLLSEDRTQSRTAQPAPQPTPSPHDWHPVKQEPIGGVPAYPNPASVISQHLCTLPDFEEGAVEMPMHCVPDQPMYDEPLMDSLPLPPPNSASPPYFQPSSQSQAITVGTSRNQWEEVSPCLPTSRTLSELPPPAEYVLLPQQYTSSSGSETRSHRRHSRSPSPTPYSMQSGHKKPALACLFCRGRKIACGPPPPSSMDKTCNQCARRHLKCEYPSESRRGKRKHRPLIPRTSTPGVNPDGPTVCTINANRKQSVDMTS